MEVVKLFGGVILVAVGVTSGKLGLFFSQGSGTLCARIASAGKNKSPANETVAISSGAGLGLLFCFTGIAWGVTSVACTIPGVLLLANNHYVHRLIYAQG